MSLLLILLSIRTYFRHKYKLISTKEEHKNEELNIPLLI